MKMLSYFGKCYELQFDLSPTQVLPYYFHLHFQVEVEVKVLMNTMTSIK